MKQPKTAKGKDIDMAALAKANEDVRAVGNVAMNARGDRIDASGNVIATVQKISQTQYNNTTLPEKKKLSSVGTNTPTKPSKKPAKNSQASLSKEVSRTVKQRDDGSSYTEIEYDDGSIRVEEVGK